MEKVEKFTKPVLKMLRREIDEALKPLAERLGLRIEQGNIQFGETSFKMKIEVKLAGAPSKTEERAVQWDRDFREFAKLNMLEGLTEADLGTAEFEFKGSAYIITGYDPGRPKYSIIAQRVGDSHVGLFPLADVARKIAKKREAENAA